MELFSASFWLYAAIGAGVGLAIGATGVGGGSLMTPILLFRGVSAPVAIGTDLLYAAITKSGGVISHQRQGNVRWRVVALLSAGSLPGALLTAFALQTLSQDPDSYQRLLRVSLGVMLLGTATLLISREVLRRQITFTRSRRYRQLARRAAPTTFAVGLLLGPLVTLSSVGAGVIGTAALMILYPRLPPTVIVGTELAHAVPLSLVAGIGHWLLGNIDWMLLAALLLGSLPAVRWGARISNQVPSDLLRYVLTAILLGLGVRFTFWP